ncbi:MAG: dipicolinate synthase subunit A [Ruminococcus sp.]|nr:dipicolinate synthase subunit A [Ruminococcus sp.]
MSEPYKILVAGGDMRQIYCALQLAERYDVSVTGFDSSYTKKLKNAVLSENKYDCAVFPVVPVSDDGFLSTPCFSDKIRLSDIADSVRKGGLVFSGLDGEKLSDKFADCEIVNYMNSEELNIRNAVPTAEGAVQTALEELSVTLSGLKVLIVGMGRTGTALTEILKGFGADITVAVHSHKGTANALLHGVKSIYTKDIGNDYGLVFNTAPSMVFNRYMLSRFDSSTLFIDLASKPGGIDFNSAIELGIKVIWALGLPGKTAPVTSGKIIAETIDEIITERRKQYV